MSRSYAMNATKSLPSSITSYDLLKTFAVIIMIIDHIGLYFFPDDLWWRAVGRIGFPVWFFLVGHASGRDLPSKLLIGAGALIVANFFAGMTIFPLNALVTIIIIRLVIDKVMAVALQNEMQMWRVSAILFVLALPTGFLMEYGTLGLITAMFGYMVRHRAAINNDDMVIRFMLFALGAFIVMQVVSFGFSTEQFLFMALGTAAVRLVLYSFKPASYPTLGGYVSSVGRWFAQLCGRRTLEIYIVHLLAFKALAVYLGLEGFGLLDWSWFLAPES